MNRKITIRVDEITKRALQIEAGTKGFSLSVYVRRILMGIDKPIRATRAARAK